MGLTESCLRAIHVASALGRGLGSAQVSCSESLSPWSAWLHRERQSTKFDLAHLNDIREKLILPDSVIVDRITPLIKVSHVPFIPLHFCAPPPRCSPDDQRGMCSCRTRAVSW